MDHPRGFQGDPSKEPPRKISLEYSPKARPRRNSQGDPCGDPQENPQRRSPRVDLRRYLQETPGESQETPKSKTTGPNVLTYSESESDSIIRKKNNEPDILMCSKNETYHGGYPMGPPWGPP